MTSPGLLRCRTGGASAEFSLVLPLLLLLLLGIVDAGRFMWEVNRAEKATQVGARVAAVTDSIAPELVDEDYAGQEVDEETIGPGGPIPVGALGTILCTSAGCECVEESGPCPDGLGTLSGNFDNLVARMQAIMPSIEADNVEVRYSGSGLGTAGSLVGGGPTGGGGGAPADTMEISPLITVSLTGLEFRPVTTLLLAQLTLPGFATTLTAEDVSGSYSE